MEIIENASLKNFNTFGIDCKAKALAFLKNPKELPYLFENIRSNYSNYNILGGGSNVLFVGDYDGLIIKNDIKGIRILESGEERVLLDAAAGEDWSRFVEICISNKYYGLENLALIPGSVGAAPVQNIGAYGVEQKEFFHSLEYYHIEKQEFIEMYLDECKFSYRDSIFKNELKHKAVITSVRYKLNRLPKVNLSYNELKQEIEKFVVVEPSPEYIYTTVKRLRSKKLPDPANLPNAGSFFQNPIVNKDKFQELQQQNPNIPFFLMDYDKIKIPAGWLIEQCGWKGKRIGDAGVYDKHALIIVNYGNASGNEILHLSQLIKESVEEKFGINLEYEVNIIASN